jgi:hypothetical protein
MKEARQRQHVELPEFHGIQMNENDVVEETASVRSGCSEDERRFLSAHALANHYTDAIWKESFTLDKHVGQMWRKISYHLPKAICTLKILRLLFKLMGDQLLLHIDSKDGNRSYHSNNFPDTFVDKMNDALNTFFDSNTRTIEIANKKKTVLLLTPEDVEIGFHWTRWKLQTIHILFSTKEIQAIVNARLGKPAMLHSSLPKYVLSAQSFFMRLHTIVSENCTD